MLVIFYGLSLHKHVTYVTVTPSQTILRFSCIDSPAIYHT